MILSFGALTTTFKVPRVAGKAFAEDHHNFSSENNLDEIVVFDWEADGSLGDLPVPVERISRGSNDEGELLSLQERVSFPWGVLVCSMVE